MEVNPCDDREIVFDLAGWQGEHPPWPAIAAAGVRAAIVKTWHGSYIPPVSRTQVAEAVEADLWIGRYGWLVSSGKPSQVDGWEDDCPLGIWADCEEKGLTHAFVHEVVQRLRDKSGRLPGLYVGSYFWDEMGGGDCELCGSCDLWLPAYPGKRTGGTAYQAAAAEVCEGKFPRLPTPWREKGALIWQFDGDRGLVMPDGVDVDVNTANGPGLLSRYLRRVWEAVP